MELSTVVMGLIALILFVIALSRGQTLALDGLKAGVELLLSVAPRLLFAFAISGLIQVLIPRGFIVRWIGRGSGWKGLLIASMAGVFTPGGPILSFPIVASLYQSGAGMGPLVSYLTSWALLGVHRLIAWEFPLLGPRFVLFRVLVSILMPPFAGWLVSWLAHE